MFFTTFPSPLGTLTMTSDSENLTGLYLPTQSIAGNGIRNDSLPVFQQAAGWLADYFRGNSPDAGNLPLSPAGTPFQRKVWDILLTIPYGETTTYGAIAKAISPTMSAQAVGGAVGRNPISIIIPCHRVVGTNRKLTGYAGGIQNKAWLLSHEEETK